MSCPPGYREVTSRNQNGGLIVSCVPEISSAPETCSDSLFYQLLTGLPPCRSTTAPAPNSSADPRTQAEQNAADSYQRMIEALRRYRDAQAAQAAGATTPGPGPGTSATGPGNADPAYSGKQPNPYAPNPNVARVVALGVGAVLIILALVKLQG